MFGRSFIDLTRRRKRTKGLSKICEDFLKRLVSIDMKYKGYEAAVDFDDDMEMFHGVVINTRDVITFYGRSVAELKKEFKASVEDYLEFCKQRGEDPDRPFSGNFVVRISPSLHQRLYSTAKKSGKSLNSLIEEKLASV